MPNPGLGAGGGKGVAVGGGGGGVGVGVTRLPKTSGKNVCTSGKGSGVEVTGGAAGVESGETGSTAVGGGESGSIAVLSGENSGKVAADEPAGVVGGNADTVGEITVGGAGSVQAHSTTKIVKIAPKQSLRRFCIWVVLSFIYKSP